MNASCEYLSSGSRSWVASNRLSFPFSFFLFFANSSAGSCAQCGVDIVDTNRRSNEAGPAEDYLRYFTEHFTEKEWDAIRR